jgi:hypothetical protein
MTNKEILRKLKIQYDDIAKIYFVEIPQDVLSNFNATVGDSIDWIPVKDTGNSAPGGYIFRKSE